MNQLEWNLRNDICEVARRLYHAGFMSGGDGNLSTILGPNEVLVTPSRLCKGFLTPDQIVMIDKQGNQLSGDYPATSEVAMHLAAYEERPDICSVAHCHPPILVAFTVAGLDLPENILPEIELLFGGKIPMAQYATPGGSELADSIRDSIRVRENSAVLLDHHGFLAIGQDIYQAAMRVEQAEAAAKVIYYARQLGGEKPLAAANVDKLHQSHRKIVETDANIYSGYCQANECQSDALKTNDPSSNEEEIEQIVRRVVRQALERSR
jgi:L-fuculose-phosphate aldolase